LGGIRARHLRFSLLVLLISTTHADTLTGTVVAVVDGDTVTVLDTHHEQHRVGLAGIDVPEKAQPFGQRSRESRLNGYGFSVP
jgi:endonuclease YncB( thermonuclease family)